MKILKQHFIIASFVLLNSISFSQELHLKVNSSLTYKFTEFDKPVGYTFLLDSLAPNLAYDWDNSNKEDNEGSGRVMKEALAGAINLTFFYTTVSSVVMYDRLPSFLVSTRIYNELKATGRSRIRLQDGENSNELAVIANEEYEVTVNDVKQKVNVIHVNINGNPGQEIWILDNAEMPVVVRLKAEKNYELKSVIIK